MVYYYFSLQIDYTHTIMWYTCARHIMTIRKRKKMCNSDERHSISGYLEIIGWSRGTVSFITQQESYCRNPMNWEKEKKDVKPKHQHGKEQQRMYLPYGILYFGRLLIVWGYTKENLVRWKTGQNEKWKCSRTHIIKTTYTSGSSTTRWLGNA